MVANRKSSSKRKSTKNNIGGLDIIRIAKELSEQKGLDFEIIINALQSAIDEVARKQFGNGVEVNIDRENGIVSVHQKLTVVDDECALPGEQQITLSKARLIVKGADIGDVILQQLSLNMDIVSAKTAQEKISQVIRDAEFKKQYEDFKDKIGEVRYGIVKQVEYSDLIVDINGNRAFLPFKNLIGNELFHEGDRIKAYIQAVKCSGDGRQVILSRIHEGFLAELLKKEVPEVADGLVSIKAIARDPGSRSKIAVFSSDRNIDPVGACVGIRGDRIKAVIQELNGEKIDVINYSSELGQFVINAITPAEVLKVIIDEDKNCVELIIHKSQLSLAIGRKGQNVRLASELVGWKIEVTSGEQESERRAREFKQCSALFGEALNVEEIISQLLVTEGFVSIEDIAGASVNELSAIEGFDEDVASELHNRANKYLREEDERKIENLRNLGIEENVINLPLSVDDKIKLGDSGIRNLQDVADLSSYELRSILSSSASRDSAIELENLADSIIMEARRKLEIIS